MKQETTRPSTREAEYIPAFGLKKLTHLYDRLIRWTMPELRIKQELVESASLRPGQKILDLGCGTGTLLLVIHQKHPDLEFFGIDGDPKILQIAQQKAQVAGVPLDLQTGMAFELPYADHSFDQVFSTLVLHHLTTQNKIRAMREVLRVLKPGGVFHLADFGKPHNRPAFIISLVIRRLEQTKDNIRGALPDMLRSTGFIKVEETDRYMTVFGTIRSLKAIAQSLNRSNGSNDL